MAGFEGLPQYTDGRALRRPKRRFRQGRVLVTGAAGIIGTVVANHLGDDLRLVGLDVSKSPVRRQFDRFRVGSVADRDLLTRLAKRCETVLHLATGAARGWDGLLEVEINGTRNVLDAAMAAGCRRVVLASSIHAAGWDVVEARASGGPRRPPPSAADPARPSGLYAVGKITAEALGRACAEWSGLGVSAIRFGTVQPDDDVARAAHGRGFRNLGPDPATVEQNLRLSWCHHTDLRPHRARGAGRHRAVPHPLRHVTAAGPGVERRALLLVAGGCGLSGAPGDLDARLGARRDRTDVVAREPRGHPLHHVG